MSVLVNMFREKVGKIKDSRMKDETSISTSYSTGFMPLDFLNGTIMHEVVDGTSRNYYSTGIPDGSYSMIVGRSGSGKTTFTLQMSGNIVRGFPNSAIYMDSLEGGVMIERAQKLTRMSPLEFKEKCIIRDTGITAENFYERIKMIHDIKMEHRDDFIYDTGRNDSYGERVYKLQPTVYILDSLPLLMPEKFTEEDELSGSMGASAVAKTNAAIFKRIIPLLKSANIILFVINHILESIDINPMARKQLTLSWLKQGESLPGGRTPQYLSNNIFRLDDASKLKEEEAFAFSGSLVTLTLVKSRSNRAGQQIKLVFSQENGFDYDLSLFLMLKDAKMLKGAGAHLRIGDCPISFAQRNFKEKLRENPELQQAFIDECMGLLQKMITQTTYNDIDDSVVSTQLFNKLNEGLLVS